MIKAIFFDWFNTLADFEPSRQELYGEAFPQFGITIAPKDVIRGVLKADKYYFEENTRSTVTDRSPEEQMEVYLHYPRAILNEAGVEASPEIIVKVFNVVAGQFKKASTFVLYDDVLSVFSALKQRQLILGLLTNARKSSISRNRYLGLEPHLDLVITSGELGVDKPHPAIFKDALNKAGVEAAEAVHVGDQYELDVIGARQVGITPVLLDRYDIYPEVNDCPRIHNLTELNQYLTTS